MEEMEEQSVRERERDEARRRKSQQKVSFSFFCISVSFRVLFGGYFFLGSRLKIKWNLSRFNASLPRAKVKWAMCKIKKRKKKIKNEAKKVIQLWDTQTGFQARLRAAWLRFFCVFEVSHIFQLKLNMQNNKREERGRKREGKRERGTTGISPKFFRNFVTCVS